MDLTKVSKYISRILRHTPEEIGIVIDKHGWANVNELVEGISKKYKEFNFSILEDIVKKDEKKRYAFNEDKTKIRANQGHSINVDVEPLKLEPPEILYHGTATKSVESIDKEGLKPMSRLYVQLSLDEETAINVGKRHGEPVLYIVKAKEMYNDGYDFFLSANGIWMVKSVPVKYLEKQ